MYISSIISCYKPTINMCGLLCYNHPVCVLVSSHTRTVSPSVLPSSQADSSSHPPSGNNITSQSATKGTVQQGYSDTVISQGGQGVVLRSCEGVSCCVRVLLCHQATDKRTGVVNNVRHGGNSSYQSTQLLTQFSYQLCQTNITFNWEKIAGFYYHSRLTTINE